MFSQRHSRFVTISAAISLIVVVSTLGLLTSLNSANAETLGSWTSTTGYPTGSFFIGIQFQSCATSSGYIYCVGGNAGYGPVDNVTYASISGSGVGTWTATTIYPSNIVEESCAISSGYIYCVGGSNGGGDVDSVYYASVSSSGVGTWTSTTNYPFSVGQESCATYNGYIYCVGGYGGTNAVYYATVSSSGVGTWTSTTSYATGSIENTSCVISSGYIYCVGGFTSSPTTADYYATVSSSGVGTWTSTTAYPQNVNLESCVISSGYIYCIGGYSGGMASDQVVQYAAVSSSGIGTWSGTGSYPQNVSEESCVTDSGFIYCVGGVPNTSSIPINNVYYSQISAATTSSSSTSSTTTTTTTTTSSTSSSTTSTTTTSSSTTIATTFSVPACPSTAGGTLMPVGATFTDLSGTVWIAPGGSLGGGTVSSYFFPGPESDIPPPMQAGWGGIYGTYNGQQGWIISFYCAS